MIHIAPVNISVTRHRADEEDELVGESQGSSDSFVITASVQPVDQIERQYLPEGADYQDMIVLYTDQILYHKGTEAPAPWDSIVYNSLEYNIVASHNYQHSPLPHFKSYAERA